MFKKYIYKIDLVNRPFANLKYRDRTTLVLCRDGKGKFILGTEYGFYPEGIVRMVGGGIDKDEEVVAGAIREIKEELGVDINPEELVELAEVEITGTYQKKTYNHSIFLYFLNSKKDDFVAGDDVSEIIRYSEKEYRDLIKRMFSLKPDHIYTKGYNTFSWHDWGKVYGFVHQVALDEFLAKNI